MEEKKYKQFFVKIEKRTWKHLIPHKITDYKKLEKKAMKSNVYIDLSIIKKYPMLLRKAQRLLFEWYSAFLGQITFWIWSCSWFSFFCLLFFYVLCFVFLYTFSHHKEMEKVNEHTQIINYHIEKSNINNSFQIFWNTNIKKYEKTWKHQRRIK